MRDWMVVAALFVILGVMTLTNTFYAREAEGQAKKVNNALEHINITSQNRCIIQVVLSYPPPITQDQFDVVLDDYDKCIKRETETR